MHGRLRGLEASLAEAAAAGGSTAEQQQRVVAYGLASVLQAYRMATAFAQMAGELAATLTVWLGRGSAFIAALHLVPAPWCSVPLALLCSSCRNSFMLFMLKAHSARSMPAAGV